MREFDIVARPGDVEFVVVVSGIKEDVLLESIVRNVFEQTFWKCRGCGSPARTESFRPSRRDRGSAPRSWIVASAWAPGFR